MKTAIPFLLCVVLALFTGWSSAQEASKAAPEDLVKELYKAGQEKSPFFQSKDRKLLDHYFARELADLIWKDIQTSKDEVGAIDFDPLYNAQDTEIKKLVINKAQTTDGKTTVFVTFTNFDEKKGITFHLVSKDAAWKISDIDYGEGTTLLKLLNENAGN